MKINFENFTSNVVQSSEHCGPLFVHVESMPLDTTCTPIEYSWASVPTLYNRTFHKKILSLGKLRSTH